MSNSTLTDTAASQRVSLLANVGAAYLPVASIICYCAVQYATRSGLAKLRVTEHFGRTGATAFHSGIRMLIYALLLRIAWMVLLAENFAGKLTGPSCYTGVNCTGQIFHSALNRFSALFYFLFLCRVGPYVGRAWGSAWSPPSLVWDMSLLATDFFLLFLQGFVLVLSWALPADAEYSAIYEAYQWQVSILALLCAAWFAVFALAVASRGCRAGGQYSQLSDGGAGGRLSNFPSAGVATAVGAGAFTDGSGQGSSADTEGTPLLTSSSSRSLSISGGSGGAAVDAQASPAGSGKRRSSSKRRGAVHVRREELPSSPWGKFVASAEGSWNRCGAWCCGARGCGPPPCRGGWCTCSLSLEGLRASWPAVLTAGSCFIISCLFFIRIILFLFTPLTGGQLTGAASAATYPHFFYTLPETLPPLLLLHLCMPGGLWGMRTWYDRV